MEFIRYTYEVNARAMLARVDFDQEPDADWEETMLAAGFDPNDEDLGWGTLTEAWNGHPAGSIVVSENTVEGHRFAVAQ